MTKILINAEGSLTLDPAVVDHLQAGPGEEVDVDLLPNGQIVLKRKPGSTEGSVDAFFHYLDGKTRVKATLDEIDDAIRAGWAGQP